MSSNSTIPVEMNATARARRRSLAGFAVSVVLLATLVLFTVRHVGDASRFVVLLDKAQPGWLVVAVACQVATYVCMGAIWGLVASTAGFPLRLSQLARLAVEKLSMDHLVPTGGLAGNVVVVGAMRRLGVAASVATEALLVDILAYYGAYGLAAIIALVVMELEATIPGSLAAAMLLFGGLVLSVPIGIRWMLRHRSWSPGPRLSKWRWIVEVRNAVATVSPERVRNPSLIIGAGVLHLFVFVLDAGTIWALLRAVGVAGDPLVCFSALVVASISATVSFLPGGVGTFEAGAIGTLVLLGISAEAALAATLLFRGLSLWIPLVPGFFLTRRDLAWWAEQGRDE